MNKIAVIGAGISGLSCAYELQKKGFKVDVFEKNNFVGGRMSSRKKDGWIFDIGANHLSNLYHELRSYCKELDIDWHKMDVLNYRVLKNKTLVPFSKSINLLSWNRLAIQALKISNDVGFFNLSKSVKYDTDNAYDYFTKKIGKSSTDYIIEGCISTYQFHRSKEMSLGAVIGLMNAYKNNKSEWPFYNLHGTKGGMSTIPEALAKKLNVKISTPVTKITAQEKIHITAGTLKSYDAVVIATTANVTNKILNNPTKKQKAVISGTKYATTISIAFEVPTSLLEQIFIVWTPYIESKTISAYTNEAMKGEEFVKGDKTLLCVWLHEKFAKNIIEKSDEDIFSSVRKEFIKIFPDKISADLLKNHDLQRWPYAMPKFVQGHLTRVKEFMENGQGENNVFLCGDYLNSPWTEGATRCGQRVAQQVISSLEAQQ